jgi:hypothetical protein
LVNNRFLKGIYKSEENLLISKMESNPLWIGLANEVNSAVIDAIRDQKKSRREAHIEIEIQFGTFVEPADNEEFGRFFSTVAPSAFFRLLNTMKKITSNYTVSEIEDNIHKQERVSYNRITKKTSFYDKKRIYSSYNIGFESYSKESRSRAINKSSSSGQKLAQDFNMKITVSNEYSFEKESKYFKPSSTRTKKRTSFDFKNQYGGYLDLTIVEEQFGQDPPKKKYEVEFEITESFDKFRNKIEKLSMIVISILQDSVIPYTNSQKIEMYKYVSDLLDIDNYRDLKFSLLPEARDLRITDMVFGGIVGNKSAHYCVTHKADGIRKLIVTTPTSIWAFVPGTQDANLLYKFRETEYNSVPPFQEGFIFDGEILTKENRRDGYESKYLFYIFDCLCENKEDIRSKNYMERMELALRFTEHPIIEIKNVVDTFGERTSNENVAINLLEPPIRFNEFKIRDSRLNKTIKFLVKGYMSLTSVEHFFDTMRLMFLQQTDLSFKQDGFMFIPLTSTYNPYNDGTYKNFPPIFQRSLTEFPDICKWKPVELRSIDFFVEHSDKKDRVVLKAIEGKTLQPFTGTGSYPLSDRIDTQHPLLQNESTSSTIVEFYWDSKRQLLTPSRIRSDKPAPNKLQTAKIIWKNIFKGIDKETLIGESFQLMREYHNQIKKKLLSSKPRTRNNKVLLDIGSGRGGDINKWSQYDLIFAVEPNEDHRKELMSRLKTSKIGEQKVIIIPTKGEDYKTITKTIQEKYGDKVSTVSMMLCFSFFDNDNSRNAVRKTIEDNLEIGGRVLVLTINGDTVEQVFRPSSGEYKEKTLKFLNSELTYDPNSGSLNIDIPGTIVKNQKERPPKLSELFKKWDKFIPLDLSRADKQPFLNSGEKPFSNMYSSFTWIRLSKSMFDIEIERVVPLFTDPQFYGISVLDSDYFFLSAVLKATDKKYQDNNDLKFRRSYVVQKWKSISETLTETQRQMYKLPWSYKILDLFSSIFGIDILYIKDKNNFRFKGGGPKIVIHDSFLVGQMNVRGQLTVIF